MNHRGDSEVVDGGRIARLRRLTGALAHAVTADDVAAITVEAGLAEAGSAVGGVWLPEGDQLVAVRARWADPRQGDRLGRVPIAAQLPASDAYRTRAAVWVGSPEESRARYPSLEAMPDGYFALPLVGARAVLGVFAGRLNRAAMASAEDRTFLTAIADLCGQALERAQTLDKERRARTTLEFLAEATEAMITTPEPEDVLQRLVRLAVPGLAPWCAVWVRDARGLRRAAVKAAAGPQPGTAPDPYLPAQGDDPVSRVFRTGVAEVVRIDDAMLRRHYPGAAAHVRRVGLTAAILVPIRLHGRGLGVLGLGFAGDGDTAELRFAASGLAARAALALENAQRHREQQELVVTLSEALLPRALPSLDGYDLAARYVPSSGAVCGDWYEAFGAADGTLLLGLGDASGHGIGAASTMALVRNAALGLRDKCAGIDELLTGLSDLVQRARPDDLVTAIYLSLDPPTGQLEWCSAGHPHGLIAGADGPFGELPGVHGPPLGVARDHKANHDVLVPGGTLLLFSDGVIERRAQDITVGLQRLLGSLTANVGATADAMAARIIDELCGEPEDDCCVLVVRRALSRGLSERTPGAAPVPT